MPFAEHKYLDAARDFCERVKVEDLIAVLANREVADTEEFVTELRTNEHALYGEIDSDEENHDTSQKRIATAVKNMWELQSFVVALDSIESVGTLAKLVGEYVCHSVPPFLPTGMNTKANDYTGPARRMFLHGNSLRISAWRSARPRMA